MTLEEAIRDLYRIAVQERKSTSTARLSGLAQHCVEELQRRGLDGAQTELTLPGGGRDKNWDVVWVNAGKPRLAISLKSILQNPGGTVPNRIDDMMGEATNLQMYSPEVVIGYLMVFDVSIDTPSGRKRETTWCEVLRGRLGNLTGRHAPSWSVGMVEASVIVQVDFSGEPRLLTGEEETGHFFDRLAQEVKNRNPGIGA